MAQTRPTLRLREKLDQTLIENRRLSEQNTLLLRALADVVSDDVDFVEKSQRDTDGAFYTFHLSRVTTHRFTGGLLIVQWTCPGQSDTFEVHNAEEYLRGIQHRPKETWAALERLRVCIAKAQETSALLRLARAMKGTK